MLNYTNRIVGEALTGYVTRIDREKGEVTISATPAQASQLHVGDSLERINHVLGEIDRAERMSPKAFYFMSPKAFYFNPSYINRKYR